MQLKYETIEQENSQVLLKITVDQEEVKKEYEELLAETQKSAQIKGFRKGKVPRSVLETKFKKGFLAESASKIIEKAFKDVSEKLDENVAPLPYAMPQLGEFVDPELGADYTFELTYDTYPKVTIGDFKEVEIEEKKVELSDKDVQSEIDRSLREFMTVEPKDGEIAENDIVLLDCVVTHEGEEFYNKEGEHIYVGKNYDTFKLGEDLIGMKKGEEKEYEKSFGDEEIEKIKGKTFSIKLKVNEVKAEILPELTDEIAEQINAECKTVEELKTKIKTGLEDYVTNATKQTAVNDILEKLLETFEGQVPESMVTKQKDAYFSDFVRRFAGDEKRAMQILKKQGISKEEYLDKFTDEAKKEVKKGLIIREIIKAEDIKIEDEDRRKFFEPFAQQYGKGVDELIELYGNGGQMEYFDGEIESQKAIDFMYDNVKKKEGEKITLEELHKK